VQERRVVGRVPDLHRSALLIEHVEIARRVGIDGGSDRGEPVAIGRCGPAAKEHQKQAVFAELVDHAFIGHAVKRAGIGDRNVHIVHRVHRDIVRQDVVACHVQRFDGAEALALRSGVHKPVLRNVQGNDTRRRAESELALLLVGIKRLLKPLAQRQRRRLVCAEESTELAFEVELDNAFVGAFAHDVEVAETVQRHFSRPVNAASKVHVGRARNTHLFRAIGREHDHRFGGIVRNIDRSVFRNSNAGRLLKRFLADHGKQAPLRAADQHTVVAAVGDIDLSAAVE
jgi:hypothetical protein